MPYLGSTPNASFSSRTKQDFTANGSTTAFTLSSAVASPNDIEVFVGNVRQEPTDAYTVNGTTLTMSEAPETGLNFYVVFKGVEENSVLPADGTISSAKIATNAVTNAKIATGITASKLTGALPAISGAALTGISQDYVKLADVNSTTSVSSVDISLDYSDYKSFQLYMYILGTSTNASENLDIRYKRDGQSSFDTGSNYGTQNILVDNGSSRNENGTNSSVELFTTNQPSHGWTSTIFFNGFGASDRPSEFHFFNSKSGPSMATWIGGGGYNTSALKLQRVTDIQLSFTNGNIGTIRYQLYGMK